MTYAASITAIALKNVQLFDAIREQSVTDALTGCATRSHGLELLGRELRRAARSGTTVSLLMIDADGFKAINDSYGHLCGDAVLRYVGGVLRSSVRATDVPCRYGGEEFLILLPETSSGGAAKLAESIRRTLAAAKVPCDASTVTVTVSCGVATTRAGEIDASALIGRADAALYEAKSAGRNRVHVDGEPRQETRPSRDPAEWLGRERRNPNRPDRRRHSGGRRRTDLVEQQQ
jgi:diguanylate cyclase (GGDEF)-like protein